MEGDRSRGGRGWRRRPACGGEAAEEAPGGEATSGATAAVRCGAGGEVRQWVRPRWGGGWRRPAGSRGGAGRRRRRGFCSSGPPAPPRLASRARAPARVGAGHHPELPTPRSRLPRSAPASRRLLRRAPARPWARTGVLRRVPVCLASPGRPAPRRRTRVRPASAGYSYARAGSPSPPPGRSASASHRLQPPARPRHELSLPSQAPLGPPSSFAPAGLPPSAQPGPAGSVPPGFDSPRADSLPCPPVGSRGPASPCLGRLAPLVGVRLVAPPC
nr:vegetative cell wall protein gp1-like [Aegilops tauschii subsp. strangulata]